MSSLFTYAMDRGHYEGQNPAHAKLPDGLPQSESDTGAYSLAQVDRLISLLPDPRDQVIVALAGKGGFRKGELAGLRWPDYCRDGEEAFIKVERSVWEGIEGVPKSKTSKASVPLVPSVAHMLDSYREYCGNPTDGWMFPAMGSKKGKPINLANLARRTLRPIMQREGIPSKDLWHSFRRGLATILYDMGANEKTIQAILRHASTDTTRKHYVKALNERKREAVNMLDQPGATQEPAPKNLIVQ
ncbi:MAG TPA: site-specific integrase [Candidatus Angelobacter sp.]|nr:site-specific integrase [Candidatus Angelobacter sp.]